MKSIDIADDVFDRLVQARVGFETPSDVVERLLTRSITAAKGASPAKFAEAPLSSKAKLRRKARKADLQILVRKGLLHEGEILTFLNYSSEPQRFSAKISGGKLEFEGEIVSMSALAQRLLREIGFSGAAVAGPPRWQASNGKTVKALWRELLEKEPDLAS